MSSSRSRQAEDVDVDWGTDALTGLIKPRTVERSQRDVVASDTQRAEPSVSASLPAPRTLPPPPTAPAAAALAPPPVVATASRTLWWAYAVLGVLALGACIVLARRAASEPTEHGVQTMATSATPLVRRPAAIAKLETCDVRDPTAKAAASAFARGDYREALGQYRALAQQYPQEPAYQSLIRVLERRLAAKAPSE